MFMLFLTVGRYSIVGLKMMNFGLKMMNCALKMMNFALKMMNSACQMGNRCLSFHACHAGGTCCSLFRPIGQAKVDHNRVKPSRLSSLGLRAAPLR